MHEASLLAGLVRRIAETAQSAGARRVLSVSVRLGALSHISAEHLAVHFVEASAGTIAEGARLQVGVSEDLQDPFAQDLVLEGIEVET